MPNGTIAASTHEGELDWPDIPEAARKIHLVPDFHDQSLISMGIFCDAGCEAHFTANTVTITYQDRIVLTGTRTPATRLWHLHPPQPKPEQACGAIGSATPAAS